MNAIGTHRQHELELLLDELQRAGRTVEAATRLERSEVCTDLVDRLHRALEPHAVVDVKGFAALGVWLDALAIADPGDVDLLQELLYGIDALVRVHLWRESGLPLRTPASRRAAGAV